MSASWRAPAVLLLLQGLCWCFAGTATAQVPSCPINITATNLVNLTSPAVINIPATGDAVFRLAPGTNYTIAPTPAGTADFTVHDGQTICIEGLGGDNQAVVIQAVAGSVHLALQGGSVLHLSGLTLQGDPALAAGGISAPGTNAVGSDLVTITSSGLRLTKMGQTAIRLNAAVKFTAHNLEIVDNVHQSPTVTAGALYFSNYFGAVTPSTFDFRGQTLVQGNKGPSFGAGGSVALRFKGAALEVRGNKAVGATLPFAVGGGLLFTNSDQASDTSVEFAAESTIFANNVADAGANPTADAGGAAMQVLADKGNVTLTFSKPVAFVENVASSNVDAGVFAGGALSLVTLTSPVGVTLNVLSCMSFTDNLLQPYGSANASAVGAALSLGPETSVTVSGPSGQLLFANNTVSGIGDQDVSIIAAALSNTTIRCPAVPAKGPGLYRVSYDICAASGASVTSGGNIVGPPASCTAGPNACTGLPAAVANSNGWQCPFPDVSPEGTTCSSVCVAGFSGKPVAICTASVWQTTGSCAGCTPPPPSGGTTLISGYSSCSTSLVNGSYTVGTVCIPVCASDSSGGLVRCGQASPAALPGWQVTPCKPDCLGNPPATVPGMAPWPCGGRTPAGETCTAACDTSAGWTGGPVTAICTASGWSNATTGSCKRVACIGGPSPQPPNATFTCTSTPVGRACVAKCSPGLTGSPRSFCLETGFGPVQGECVDCAGTSPKIAPVEPASVLQNSTRFTLVAFNITGGFTNGRIVLQATLDGTILCRPEPADLTGVQVQAPINVTCLVSAGGLAPGPHSIALTGRWGSGNTGCGTGLISQVSTIFAVPPPPPVPAIKLLAAGATPPCKTAADRPTSFTANFNFEVTLVTPINVYATVATSPPPEASCTVSRSGPINQGQISVNCTGVFNTSVTSVNVTLTLAADVPAGSIPTNATLISASSTQTIGFVCCVAGGRQSVAHVVDAARVAESNAYCRTCGSRRQVEGVWQLPRDAMFSPPLQRGVLRTGQIVHGPTGSRNDPLPSEQCSSDGPDVGVVDSFCDDWQMINGVFTSNLMRLVVEVPAGSSLPVLQYQARCTMPPPLSSTQSCIAGSYSWRTVSERDNSLKVVGGVNGGLTLSFGILISPTAGCNCQSVTFALRTTGVLALGRAPDGNGSCADPEAAMALGAGPRLSKQQARSSAAEVVPADLAAAANAERLRVRNSQIPVAPLPAASRP